jgi:hypothetical protein
VRWVALIALVACGGSPAPKAPVVPAAAPTRESCESAIRAAMQSKGGAFDELEESDREQMIADCQRDGAP